MKVNITSLILLALIMLFFWLWISDTPEVIIDDTKEKELMEIIRLKDLEINKSNTVIDSVNILLHLSIVEQEKIQKELNMINIKYDEEINTINNQFINADIEWFLSNYLSDSTSNR